MEEMWLNHPRQWVEYDDRYVYEPYDPEQQSYQVDELDLYGGYYDEF